MPLHDVLRQRLQPLTATVTSNRIFLYSIFSTFAVAATIANACRAQSNFYSVAIYLSKSSRSVLVLANFGFLCALLSGRIFQRIFFGTLQPREVERLYDQTWMFVTESLLAFTIFRDEFDVPFLLMFGFLLFIKCFHWLMADRIESMDQTPYPGPPTLFHIRINALFVVLWVVDTTMFAFAVENTLANGVGGMVLFASEYAILLASALNAMLRYALSILDLRRARTRGGENAPPWENKSMYIFYIELLTDFLKLTTYMTFFMIILTFYGLPLNIIRDVFVTARSFITRLRALIRYHNATRDMDRRYPDATEAELAEMTDRTCIICREEMQSRTAAAQPDQAANGDQPPAPPADGPNMTPKKLPCGHIFHFQCLRSWLERQQSCPTCRRTVLENNTPQNARQAPGQNQQGPAPPRPGAVPGAPPVQPGAGIAGNGPLGWVGRIFGVPQPPALAGQFPGPQGQFAQGAPPPLFQQHAVPNAGWGGPVPGQAPPPPPPAFYDPVAGWQHHAHPGHAMPPPPPMQQPPMFRGFYGPGQVWQPWGDPNAFGQQPQEPAHVPQHHPDTATSLPPAQPQQAPSASGPSATDSGERQQNVAQTDDADMTTPTPTAAPSASRSNGRQSGGQDDAAMDARRAAALAALRRLQPSTAGQTPPPAHQTTDISSTAPLADAVTAPGAAPTSAEEPSPTLRPTPTISGASSSTPTDSQTIPAMVSAQQAVPPAQAGGQPTLPTLIPLYDPSVVQLTRVPGPNPYYAPYNHIYRNQPARPGTTQRPSAAGQPNQTQLPRSARAGPGGSRTPLAQLPPSLTEEQLGRLDRLTREAIDERIRVLEGVSGAIYRCMEELYRVRSVLPATTARRANQPQSTSPPQSEPQGQSQPSSQPSTGSQAPPGAAPQREAQSMPEINTDEQANRNTQLASGVDEPAFIHEGSQKTNHQQKAEVISGPSSGASVSGSEHTMLPDRGHDFGSDAERETPSEDGSARSTTSEQSFGRDGQAL
ncbi:hypothetical protein PYCCODRAFT_1399393 [Trametes coccinea BRFM310]|uniref:RING-type E3 ubiquitin transferase n=1 Tax=Trametes coccinea (strain BRFM310) TaxID=1353009 RepID=A0A1Y2IAY3_TRAC3|nr:hypothetical protein PYCCODRAFT_1399393 [Trametes coccinea BRFM310]